jgi:hypothetical protein
MGKIGLFIALLLAGAPLGGTRPQSNAMHAKTRLLVLTDISSLTAGVREPDDGQSMIRLMLYANELDIEGLIATSNLRHGQVTRPELIREIIAAYAKVRPNLLLHSPGYPPAERLREGVKAGQPVALPDKPVFESIGLGKDTEASDWILQVVDRPDPRPVWVTIWGGAADLAQALWKVRETRKPEEAAAFVARLRVHAIGDQDSTCAWIKRTFPALFYITQGNSMRGMYRGGETALASSEWVEKHVRQGHGALGALYPDYDGGDIWARVRGVKEGDTPSFLGLIPNGLSTPDQPELGGWGGRCRQMDGNPCRYEDTVDVYPGAEQDRAPGMATVYRWRPAYQADFQARLNWCLKPYREANHPPVVRIEGERQREVSPGETVVLDARASRDPDGNALTFEWALYPDTGSAGRIEDAASPVARFHVPADAPPQTIPLLLTVRDNGDPPLSRYARVFLKVKKQ